MSAFFLRLKRLFLYVCLTLPLMPVQALLLLARSPLAERLPRAYHALAGRILGFDTTVIGTPSPLRPTLFVVNHSSYVDIEILGGVIDASFIAKSEVKRWPLFGWLARLQRTVFVDRRAHTTHRQRDVIVERLKEGGRLILFPEGTSDDGSRVLPFKSALFAAVHGAHLEHPITVQPVSIAYVTLDGMPIGRFYRPFFAWYGDMDMASHLWAMVGLGRVGVTVEFHAPVSIEAFSTRKALAEHCWRVVSAGVASAIAGRPQPVEPTGAVRPPPPPQQEPMPAVAAEAAAGG
ncbi:MAG TPA: lysophospholipid acyltransferase family protein [Stellaceae bacterium]|nr:lysophospholipid acyltransferase family protein [Stellaceae bacterium]